MTIGHIVTSDIIEAMIPVCSRILLRNDLGTMELKGDDLVFKISKNGEWLTIFHKNAAGSEQRSHIHIKLENLGYGRIERPEGMTPKLAIYQKKEQAGQGIKAPLSFTFLSFYNWDENKQIVPENQKEFENWVSKMGTEWSLKMKSTELTDRT